ncbi:MAG: hypothetical protein ACR2PS_03340, partial [Pseudomonadales bacterium]
MLKDDGPAITAVNPGSVLGIKMVKVAFGVDGSDSKNGAEVLVRAAMADEFTDASGRYFDSDIGQFTHPHPDVLDTCKTGLPVRELETVLSQKMN